MLFLLYIRMGITRYIIYTYIVMKWEKAEGVRGVNKKICLVSKDNVIHTATAAATERNKGHILGIIFRFKSTLEIAFISRNTLFRFFMNIPYKKDMSLWVGSVYSLSVHVVSSIYLSTCLCLHFLSLFLSLSHLKYFHFFFLYLFILFFCFVFCPIKLY